MFILIFSACATPEQEMEIPTPFTAEHIHFQNDSNIFFAQMTDSSTVWALWEEGTGRFIRTFNPQSGVASLLSSVFVSEIESDYPISGLAVSRNSITILSQMEERVGISQYSMDGEKIFAIDLDFHGESDIHVMGAVADLSGRLYVAWSVRRLAQSGVSVLSDQGEVLFTISGNDNINDIVLLNGNTPMVLVNESTLKEIDSESKGWGDIINLQGAFHQIFSGKDGNVYLESNAHLYRYNLHEETLTRLFNHSVIGVTGWRFWTIALGNDVFLINSSDGLFSVLPMDTEIIEVEIYNTLTLLAASPVDPLVAIKVAEFNQQNDNYSIEILEFGELDIPRLQTEFAIGQVPDIVFYSDSWSLCHRYFPSHRLAVRGLLADLYDFIDADPILERNSFLANILDAVSTGGALYELPYFFRLDVAVGEANRLGTDMGWTFDDMLQTLDETDFNGYLFNPNNDRHSVLHIMLSLLIDDFIDWNTGVVQFDSDSFQRLLEIVKTYVPPIGQGLTFLEADLIQQERQLMMWQSLMRPNFLQLFDFYFENMVPIGFPVPYGVGHSIRYDASFSISAVSEYKNVAWSFVRQFYMPEFFKDFQERHQFLNGIPIHMEGVELLISEEEPGFILGIGERDTADFYEIVVGYATEYDIRRFRNILESATRVSRLDLDVAEIVSEEAESYFRGDRSVEETARIIQNRMQIFVSEQFR